MNTLIPIQNIYYLLCYAWNKLEEKDTVDVQSLNSTQLVDLFARVLISGTHHLVRRGFDRGYLQFEETTRRPRGRISFAATLKSNLLAYGRVQCEFDELDYNVLHNRILRTAILNLITADKLDNELREGLHEVSRRLWEIEPITLSSQLFRRVQLHRNNHYYAFLLNVCELIYENLLPSENSGKATFRDFTRDEGEMHRLFQSFVKNFYLIEQRHFRVQAPKINWDAQSADIVSASFLPQMQTDVCLISDNRKIILDCKYYKDSLQTNWGKQTVHSSALYQIFAYVKNKEIEAGWENCEGILLYPTVKSPLDLAYRIQDHLVKVKSINLNQDWQSIHEDMLRVIAN